MSNCILSEFYAGFFFLAKSLERFILWLVFGEEVTT